MSKKQQQQTLILIWLYKNIPSQSKKGKVVNFSSEIFYDKKYEIKKWVFDTKHFKFVFKILNKSFRYWYSVS